MSPRFRFQVRRAGRVVVVVSDGVRVWDSSRTDAKDITAELDAAQLAHLAESHAANVRAGIITVDEEIEADREWRERCRRKGRAA